MVSRREGHTAFTLCVPGEEHLGRHVRDHVPTPGERPVQAPFHPRSESNLAPRTDERAELGERLLRNVDPVDLQEMAETLDKRRFAEPAQALEKRVPRDAAARPGDHS